MRWSGGWCRTNSGRRRDAETITRIARELAERQDYFQG
ncbi:plasmid SOS inhibition protein A, partial [Escherichia coli]